MEKKPIVITIVHDAITRIADRDGNSVKIQLDANRNAVTAGVYLNNSTQAACPLNRAQIDNLKVDLQMPVKFTWLPVQDKPEEFYAIYYGPAQVIAQACDKGRGV